jgi:ribosome-associated protein
MLTISDDIVRILEDGKATDIKTIDVSPTIYQNRLWDTCIIASGTSLRHMQSVADHIYKYLRIMKLFPHIEGSAHSGWILIEASGIIEIHLFKPELREYYNLEELLTTYTRKETYLW